MPIAPIKNVGAALIIVATIMANTPSEPQRVHSTFKTKSAIEAKTFKPQKLASVIKPKAKKVASVSGSEAEAKRFIYQHESGNNPAAVNPTGCRGLGQACPGSKLPCGNDYACQDAWFTNYMKQRYGTWVKAKAHWLARVPINGQDVGNWW